MQSTVRQYDSKLDSKRRITLRNASFEFYHVKEFEDGSILLEPRELVAPFRISENSLSMMDQSMENLARGKTSKPLDLSEFKD